MGAVYPLLIGRIREVSRGNRALRAKLTSLAVAARKQPDSSILEGGRYAVPFAALCEAEAERAEREAAAERLAVAAKAVKKAKKPAPKKKKPAKAVRVARK
jgi:hypothetical protein